MKHSTTLRATKIIGKGADIFASTLTNTLLYCLFLYGASFGKQGSYGVHRAFEEANEALEDFNYQSIKNALNQLTRTGLIGRSRKRTELEFTITREGKKRIAQLFPEYRIHRPWDSHVYLISYDIPTNANKARNILREYIRRTGGGLLQESLWINPYNPQQLIEEFVTERGIPGTVLISKLGTDGAIGDETLPDLISRVYDYPTLTDRYVSFIERYSTKHPSIVAVAHEYMSILRDDPQLPFELEPKKFPGKEAYELFLSIQQSYANANN